jgi:hypothetical protein
MLHIKDFSPESAHMVRRRLFDWRYNTCVNISPICSPKLEQKLLPDVLIPDKWALEVKIVRPFGDNGLPAEHWSENILHPYPGNTSSLGDCMKLLQSGLPERKGIIVFGYEHAQAVVPLDPAIRSFELLAGEIMQVKLTPRVERRIEGLTHPVHQVLRVFGWEILTD